LILETEAYLVGGFMHFQWTVVTMRELNWMFLFVSQKLCNYTGVTMHVDIAILVCSFFCVTKTASVHFCAWSNFSVWLKFIWLVTSNIF
jgi:hypothetical protein